MRNVWINKGRPQIIFRTSCSEHLLDCTAIPLPPLLAACPEQHPVPREHSHASMQERFWLWEHENSCRDISLCKPIGSYRNWNLMPGSLAQAGEWLRQLGILESLLRWVRWFSCGLKTLTMPSSGPWSPPGEDLWETAVIWDPRPSQEQVVKLSLFIQIQQEVDNKPQMPCFTLTPQLNHILFSVAAFASQWWTWGFREFAPLLCIKLATESDENSYAFLLIFRQ